MSENVLLLVATVTESHDLQPNLNCTKNLYEKADKCTTTLKKPIEKKKSLPL